MSADRAYASLLAHLHSPSPALALPVIQSALAHHLSTAFPTPTPLSASAVSAPLFLTPPLVYTRLQTLLPQSASRENALSRALFGRSVEAVLGRWVKEAVTGIQGGQSVLRLACCTGLILGLEDLTRNEISVKVGGRGRGVVEDEIILALAEVMDMHALYPNDEWERELWPHESVDALTLSLILASQSLPLINQEKLKALPLPVLSRVLATTISSAYHSGNLLSNLESSISPNNKGYKIYLPSESPIASTLDSIHSSTPIQSIAPLSRLTAKTLTLLLDSSSTSPLRTRDAMDVLSDILTTFRDISHRVEDDWCKAPLAAVQAEDEIEPESRKITQSIWALLKTMLFSIIMISDAGLSSIVFLPPPTRSSTTSGPSSKQITPIHLALCTLQTLSHLSFVISQFGGVTGQGFNELRKTFYLALDILAAGTNETSGEAEAWVRGVCSAPSIGVSIVDNSKKAYALASIEQLVPVLSESCLSDYVFPLCIPHLSNPSERDLFESAHSVVLAVFAASAHQSHHPKLGSTNPTSSFVERMVPFYLQTLIKNSNEDGLSTPQLRLAFSALVGCAAAVTHNSSPSTSGAKESPALAWYCIEMVLHLLRDESQDMQAGRRHKLILALISSVSQLPLSILEKALGEIRDVILATNQLPHEEGHDDDSKGEDGQELVDALFDEILEQVGDREKETAVRWWYAKRAAFRSMRDTQSRL
ncbi:hypothetical protein BD779DRAFT_1497859 [Infundibulicybe gibba]|nr:hypothetical protein BD779DRAFT_1497859 [Infundibulicybe gibba]